MSTAKARSNNRPILAPPNAVLNPHPDLAQVSIESLLFLGQLFPLRFLKRSLDLPAPHLLFCPSLEVDPWHLTDLLGEALRALVSIRLTAVRQALDGLESIAQLFVMRLAWHGFADRKNMMLAVRHELGFEREAFFYPNSARCALCSRSDAKCAARWRQPAHGDPPTALTSHTAQG